MLLFLACSAIGLGLMLTLSWLHSLKTSGAVSTRPVQDPQAGAPVQVVINLNTVVVMDTSRAGRAALTPRTGSAKDTTPTVLTPRFLTRNASTPTVVRPRPVPRHTAEPTVLRPVPRKPVHPTVPQPRAIALNAPEPSSREHPSALFQPLMPCRS